MDHGSCFHSFRNSISNHPLTCPFDSFLLKALSSLCFLSADVFLGWIWVTMVVDIRENAWPWRIDSHVLFTYVNSGSILFNISANTNPMDPFSSGKFLCFFGSTSLNDDDRLGILQPQSARNHLDGRLHSAVSWLLNTFGITFLQFQVGHYFMTWTEKTHGF